VHRGFSEESAVPLGQTIGAVFLLTEALGLAYPGLCVSQRQKPDKNHSSFALTPLQVCLFT